MRSILRLVAITSMLAGCGTNTVVSATATGGSARPLSFAKPVAYAVDGHSPSQVRAVDIDGDGRLDLVVGAFSGIGVMRNNGDGTFEDPTWSSSGASMATTDLNGDGFGDVIIGRAEYPVGIYVLYGAADGSLGEPVEIDDVTVDDQSKVMTADMDGDGVPEIIVCGSDFATVVRVDASGKGKHVGGVDASTESVCALGDINGDGLADLVTNEDSYTVGVWMTDASGAVPKLDTPYPNRFSNYDWPSGMFMADLNGDGRADVISAFGGTLFVRIANVDGSLADPIVVTSNIDTGNTTSLAFADFDGDGHLDAVMSADGYQGTTVAILLGDGTGNLTQASIDLGLLGGEAKDVTVGDFDGDGLPDIAVAYDTRTYVLLNTSH